MTTKRDQIIDATCELIEQQGYAATGLNQILDTSGAPKGSLYYYFPEGKDELVEEAIRRTDRAIAARLNEVLDEQPDPAAGMVEFLRTLAHYVEASDYRGGGPITAVALEAASTNERLSAACADAYANWQDITRSRLVASGLDDLRARRLAAVFISIIEGAIILSRTERSARPLRDAADELELLLHDVN
jgi:TetR/AcrR family transcriptional repressor of lmrAB and yxaGH operons